MRHVFNDFRAVSNLFLRFTVPASFASATDISVDVSISLSHVDNFSFDPVAPISHRLICEVRWLSRNLFISLLHFYRGQLAEYVRYQCCIALHYNVTRVTVTVTLSVRYSVTRIIRVSLRLYSLQTPIYI